jgi:hypothetical protein
VKTSALPQSVAAFLLLVLSGCALFYGRPTQSMSDTAAAIKAAREVQADSLSPDLYRESNEWFMKAKREYKFKNFKLAKDYAEKARDLAEKAEFESLRKGGVRSDLGPAPEPAPAASPYAYPTSEGVPAEEWDQRQQQQAPQQQPSQPNPAPQAPTAPPQGS